MSFWGVVFVVLMILWLLGGAWLTYRTATPERPAAYLGGTFLPWCCVAILGYVVFGGGR